VPELLSFVLVGVWIYCLVDVATSRREDIRNLPKWAWFAIVFVLPPIGVLLWFLFGRPQHQQATRERWAGTMAREARPRVPRRPRPQADPVEDEATIRARIVERDALLARWAEEDEGRGPAGG
jgi:hypothetical protein